MVCIFFSSKFQCQTLRTLGCVGFITSDAPNKDQSCLPLGFITSFHSGRQLYYELLSRKVLQIRAWNSERRVWNYASFNVEVNLKIGHKHPSCTSAFLPLRSLETSRRNPVLKLEIDSMYGQSARLIDCFWWLCAGIYVLSTTQQVRAGLVALEFYNPKTGNWSQPHMQVSYRQLKSSIISDLEYNFSVEAAAPENLKVEWLFVIHTLTRLYLIRVLCTGVKYRVGTIRSTPHFAEGFGGWTTGTGFCRWGNESTVSPTGKPGDRRCDLLEQNQNLFHRKSCSWRFFVSSSSLQIYCGCG